MRDRIHKADLDMLLERAKGGKMLQSVDTVRLIEEFRRLRSLLVRIYPHVQITKGSRLEAELEREVVAISDEGGA